MTQIEVRQKVGASQAAPFARYRKTTSQSRLVTLILGNTMIKSAPILLRRAVSLLIAYFLCIDSSPDFYITSSTKAPTCTSHPITGYLTHPGIASDTSTVIALRTTAGTLVSGTVCPGATYLATITFPSSRQWLVTASAGVMTAANPSDPLGW